MVPRGLGEPRREFLTGQASTATSRPPGDRSPQKEPFSVTANATLSFLQNVAPKAGTAPQEVAPSAPAGGAPAPQQAPPPNPLVTLGPMLLIMLPFFWLMFRRQKKEQQERAKLKKGDRVLTQSGLVGELMDMGDQVSKLKIAAGVTVEVLTSSLQSFPQAPAKKDDVKVDAKVAAEKK